ncbi:MAG: R2-like ligand-binding oxidase [Alicyclobacillus sp.]|nr:R2-like ligand-binding oxidase [Alicyclobacillus sp.]
MQEDVRIRPEHSVEQQQVTAGDASGIDPSPEDLDQEALSGSLEQAAYKMWRKAIAYGTWDPARIDLSQDRADYLQLPRHLQVYLESFCGAFYNAEENVARLFCPWVMSLPGTWPQAYLSTQLVEEFKHTDFFLRYFREVFQCEQPQRALANPVHQSLAQRADRLLQGLLTDSPEIDRLRVEAFTHYQGIIEGVQANTGYQIFLAVFASKGLLPGLAEGFRNIQRDEGRHVGFGLRVLRHYAHAHPSLGERIREVYAEYLPLIRTRYGQAVVVDGLEYPPPPEERGVERLLRMYERRLQDIFSGP